MADMSKEHVDTLENMVDLYGLPHILECLAQCAQCKADHIGENWQDAGLETIWVRAARQLNSASKATYIGKTVNPDYYRPCE